MGMAARRARRRVSRKKRVSRKRVSRKRVSRKKKVVRKRRKARKVKVRGTRGQVWRGTRQKVKTTGQVKADLMKNKRGKIVSKAANKAGKRRYANIKAWTQAFTQARKNLKVKGFMPCKKGSKLYKETMKLYKK